MTVRTHTLVPCYAWANREPGQMRVWFDNGESQQNWVAAFAKALNISQRTLRVHGVR